MLFVPAGSETPRRKGPLRFTPEGRKRAHRILLAMGGGSVVFVLMGLALGHWGHPWFAETFVGSGVFALAFTAVMVGGVLRAVSVETGASTSISDPAMGTDPRTADVDNVAASLRFTYGRLAANRAAMGLSERVAGWHPDDLSPVIAGSVSGQVAALRTRTTLQLGCRMGSGVGVAMSWPGVRCRK